MLNPVFTNQLWKRNHLSCPRVNRVGWPPQAGGKSTEQTGCWEHFQGSVQAAHTPRKVKSSGLATGYPAGRSEVGRRVCEWKKKLMMYFSPCDFVIQATSCPQWLSVQVRSQASAPSFLLQLYGRPNLVSPGPCCHIWLNNWSPCLIL